MTATKTNTRRRFAKGLKAAELLSIIISYKTTNDGASPSLRELAERADLGLAAVSYHLGKLEAAGLIERSGRSRGIRVIGGRWVPPPQVHVLAEGELSPETARAIGNMAQAVVAAVLDGKLGKKGIKHENDIRNQ